MLAKALVVFPLRVLSVLYRVVLVLLFLIESFGKSGGSHVDFIRLSLFREFDAVNNTILVLIINTTIILRKANAPMYSDHPPFLFPYFSVISLLYPNYFPFFLDFSLVKCIFAFLILLKKSSLVPGPFEDSHIYIL